MTAYQKGVELSKAGKPAAALVAFETARAENPCDYRTHFGVGWALQKLERHEGAINAFTAAIELKKDVPGVLYSRALSSLILHRGDEALHDLDRALELSPDDIEAMYARGNSLKALERYDEALAAYSKVIAANDRHSGAHDGRAKLRHRAGDFTGPLPISRAVSNWATTRTMFASCAAWRNNTTVNTPMLSRTSQSPFQ